MSEEIEDFTLVLDPEVDAALSTVIIITFRLQPQILQSDDPLDAPDFDPVVYINAQVFFCFSAWILFVQFPDEEAMSRINTYSSELKEQINTLEEQIMQTVPFGESFDCLGERSIAGWSLCRGRY